MMRIAVLYDEDLLLIMERSGVPEETYWTFSYSPIPGDEGGIGGVFCAVTEETRMVLGERRLRVLRELAAAATQERGAVEVCIAAARCLATAPRDLPFCAIYLVDDEGHGAKLIAQSGIEPGHPACPLAVSTGAMDGCGWPVSSALQSGTPVIVERLSDRFEQLPVGAWQQSPQTGIVEPLMRPGQRRAEGFILAGLNPFRVFDADYRSFVDLVAGQVAAALANAKAHEQERERAQALAEMMSPIEEVLARSDDGVSLENRRLLDIAHRNALPRRLLTNSTNVRFWLKRTWAASTISEPSPTPADVVVRQRLRGLEGSHAA